MGFQVGFPALRNAPPLGGGGGYDADATTWINAVEAADGQALPAGTRTAMNQLVLDLKVSEVHRGVSIRMWDKMDYLLPLMGARTFTGSLIRISPAQPSPTVFNFTSSEYDTKLGLTCPGSGFYLDTGYNASGTGQDDASIGTIITQAGGITGHLIANGTSNTGTQRQVYMQGGVPVGRINSGGGYFYASLGIVYPEFYGGTRFEAPNDEWVEFGAIGVDPTANVSDSNQDRTFKIFGRGSTGGSPAIGSRQCMVWIGRDAPILSLRLALMAYYNAIQAVTY